MGTYEDMIASLDKKMVKHGINVTDYHGQTFDKPTELAQLCWDQFKIPPHISLIEEYLLKVESGEIKKQMFFMPPRHGKSELVSKYFVAWYMLRNPEKRVIFISHGHEFAGEFGLEVRDIINEYGGNIEIRDDQRKKNYFKIKDHRGSLTCTGIGGGITGKGADLLVIDDPVKDADAAMSSTLRERAKNWYRSTANTRLEPGAQQIIIQTRWHEDDLSGFLLENQPGQWSVLSLPAIAGVDDQLGRKPGEALWPERFPVDVLEQIREEASSFWFSAMYQQDPQPAEGGLLKREWIREHFVPLAGGLQNNGVMCVDLAIGGKKENDQTVICTIAKTWDNYLYVRGFRYGRWNNKANIANFAAEYNYMQPMSAYSEDTAYQRAFKEDVRDQLNIPLMGLQNSGNKEARILTTLQPLFEAGKILFPEDAPWLGDFLKEYLSFPNGKHDDMLDALQMAVDKIRYAGNPFTESIQYYEGSPGALNSGESREKKRKKMLKEQLSNAGPYSHQIVN